MIKLQTVENADHVAQVKALFQEYAETRKNDPALENFRLDSIPSMREAQKLYQSIGFYEIPAYRHNPNEGTKYYEIDLNNKSMNLT